MTKSETISTNVLTVLERHAPLAKKKLMIMLKRQGARTLTPQEFNAAILRLERQGMIEKHSSSTKNYAKYLLTTKARENGWH